MKRATLTWVKSWVKHRADSPFHPQFVDILGSDARQRAEIRRLREAFARFLLGCDLVNTHENHARLIEANKALAPKRRAKR